MRVFDDLCPRAPAWNLPWDRIRERFWWVRDMEGVPQDRVHHAEGDVAVHTRMACEALTAQPQWRRLPHADRVRMFATVLLHDVAKPRRTQADESGRITAHGHSGRGEIMARGILWRLGVPAWWRERVAALIRHHQVPFWALERTDLESIVFRVSLVASNRELAMLAEADLAGRVCDDAAQVRDSIALFREYCAEWDCLDTARAFPSDHARFEYFRTPGRDPHYAAYDDTRGTMTLLSGLPGSGKDTWAQRNRADCAVVSLDAWRARLGVGAAKNQGAVINAARDEARQHLRAGRDFVFNATNVSRRQREGYVALAADYKARVEIVALEAPPDVVSRRNGQREHPVPYAAVERMIDRWEAPDITEAHTVHSVSTV